MKRLERNASDGRFLKLENAKEINLIERRRRHTQEKHLIHRTVCLCLEMWDLVGACDSI